MPQITNRLAVPGSLNPAQFGKGFAGEVGKQTSFDHDPFRDLLQDNTMLFRMSVHKAFVRRNRL